MSPSGIGGGTDDEGIWLVDLIFSRRGKPYTIEKSREVIIDCIEGKIYLKLIKISS